MNEMRCLVKRASNTRQKTMNKKNLHQEPVRSYSKHQETAKKLASACRRIIKVRKILLLASSLMAVVRAVIGNCKLHFF